MTCPFFFLDTSGFPKQTGISEQYSNKEMLTPAFQTAVSPLFWTPVIRLMICNAANKKSRCVIQQIRNPGV